MKGIINVNCNVQFSFSRENSTFDCFFQKYKVDYLCKLNIEFLFLLSSSFYFKSNVTIRATFRMKSIKLKGCRGNLLHANFVFQCLGSSCRLYCFIIIVIRIDYKLSSIRVSIRDENNSLATSGTLPRCAPSDVSNCKVESVHVYHHNR